MARVLIVGAGSLAAVFLARGAPGVVVVPREDPVDPSALLEELDLLADIEPGPPLDLRVFAREEIEPETPFPFLGNSKTHPSSSRDLRRAERNRRGR